MADSRTQEKVYVGSIISERLEAKEMKQSELCDLTGIAKPILNDIIKGRRNLTAEMAVLIESALGLSADRLLSIQMQNELDRAYNDSKVITQLQCMSNWEIMSEYLSIPVLKKLGLPNGGVKDKVSMAMEMFHVTTIEEFNSIAEREQEQAYYKKSEKLVMAKKALFTWKYYCFDEASKITISASFDKNSIEDLKQEAKTILLENRNAYHRMQESFNNHGIRLLYINKEGQVPVDGMSFWFGKNPTVVITRRMQNIDNFAFSIMHELGHVKMHLKQDCQALVNLDGEELDEMEAQANEYALNAFISNEEWNSFMSRIKNVNPYTVHIPIKNEAKRLNVNPQILYGRYMHDMGLYRLRRVFPTNVK